MHSVLCMRSEAIVDEQADRDFAMALRLDIPPEVVAGKVPGSRKRRYKPGGWKEQYRKAAVRPSAASPIKVREDSARRRRDLSRAGRNEQLQALCAFATRLVADQVDGSHLRATPVSLSHAGQERGVGLCLRLETWKLAPAVPTSAEACNGATIVTGAVR
jgi:hypothetical protein